jgi:glutamine synthetase
LEDRRPAANMDPYLVSAALVDAACLNGKHLMNLID